MVSTLSTIPLEGLDRRKITPNIKLAIGTQRLIALYIGIFMPFRANKAEKELYKKVYKITQLEPPTKVTRHIFVVGQF